MADIPEDPAIARAKQMLADQKKLLDLQKGLSDRRMKRADEMREAQNQVWEN